MIIERVRPGAAPEIYRRAQERGRLLPPGAFLLIDADTLEEALAVASKHAAANFGEHLSFAVELRACDTFESFKS